MASNLYRVRTGTTATPMGRELLDTLEQIGDAFARLQRLFAAMTQERDGNAGNDTDFVTPAAVFGFTDASDTLSSSVAHNAYEEINAFVGNGGPSLQQCCARLKQ
jgi:hypothetical protein